MKMSSPLIDELTREAETTRRVLERVPQDKLAWKPHARSMSLGQLALHVAQTPGAVAQLIAEDACQVPRFTQAEATSGAELLAALDQSVSGAKARLEGWDDASMMTEWRLRSGANTIMALPRIGMVRSIMLNHWYHHRWTTARLPAAARRACAVGLRSERRRESVRLIWKAS